MVIHIPVSFMEDDEMPLEKTTYQVAEDYDYVLPEKKLFAAVLERAIIDLQGSDPEERWDAYEWFTEKRNGFPRFISFLDVYSTLELDASRMTYIQRLLCSCSKG